MKMQKKSKNKTLADTGRMGGQKTKKLYGKEHYRKIGQKGLAKRYGKRSELSTD